MPRNLMPRNLVPRALPRRRTVQHLIRNGIDRGGDSCGENALREFRVQHYLSVPGHPSLCKLIALWTDDQFLYPVLELLNGPRLRALARARLLFLAQCAPHMLPAGMWVCLYRGGGCGARAGGCWACPFFDCGGGGGGGGVQFSGPPPPPHLPPPLHLHHARVPRYATSPGVTEGGWSWWTALWPGCFACVNLFPPPSAARPSHPVVSPHGLQLETCTQW
jgi:hypothetical protein